MKKFFLAISLLLVTALIAAQGIDDLSYRNHAFPEDNESSHKSTRSIVFSKDFEDQSMISGGWISFSVLGTQEWNVPSTQYGHNNSFCGIVSGYDNGNHENEDWFISPQFNPDAHNNLFLSFWNTSGFAGPGSQLQLYHTDNYTGDPTTTTWAEITDAVWHDGVTNWEWTFSGFIDLSSLTGTSARIGFKYTSTTSQAATWELDDIVLSDETPAPGIIEAKYAHDGVAVDGNLEESFWNINIPITINPSGSNNNATFGLLWDDDYLYVGVDVNDTHLVNDGRQAFYADGVEIAIDGAFNQSVDFDDNDLLLAKSIRTFWLQELNDNYENMLNEYVETASGYTMEFAIPWSNINTTPMAGNSIGFNIAINDDDDENSIFNLPNQRIWHGDETYYESPQNWGEITLSGTPVGFSQSYLSLLSHDKGDFLVNGKTTNIHWFSHDVSNVKIEYSADNGSTWNTIVASTDASASQYEWLVDAPASEQMLIRISDAANATTSDQSAMENIVSEPLIEVEPLINALWHNYKWPYNAYYPEVDGGINGHLGNACGASTLSRTIHGWEFPRQGSGSLSYTDNGGTFWFANFGNTVFNYDNMPNYLPFDATEPEYTDVATLMYQTNVAMQDVSGSGTDLDNFSYLLSTYFNYKESVPVYMNDYTMAEWTQFLVNELDNGRSLIVVAMNPNHFGWHENNNIGGHWYHCDGYNENGEFHVVIGFGEYQYDGYYSIDEFPLYAYNIGILAGLEPDLGGKSLSLITPNGGESYIAGNPIEISWQAEAVSTIILEYTLDNGQTWIPIADNVDAALQSYSWTSPNSYSEQCKIRITDTADINVYDKSDASFNVIVPQLELLSPEGGESFVFDDVAVIEWQLTPIAEVDILFSDNNGASWNPIVSNYDASLNYFEWNVPQVDAENAFIKIVDSNDAANFSLSGASFKIVPENILGGPYSTDENTMLSLHFERNLFNQSDYSDHAEVSLGGDESFENSVDDDLGKAIYINSFLTVPHTEYLNLTDDWTIELWFKPQSFSTGLDYLIWKPGDDDAYFTNYALHTSAFWGNEFVPMYFSGENRIMIQGGFYPQLNEWYHVAFIRNTENSTLNLIVRNDQREILNTYSINDGGAMPLTSSQDLKIGVDYSGYIDEVRISDVVRNYEPVSAGRQDVAQNLTISPNPASEFIHINNTEKIDVQIFSLTGICIEEHININPNAMIDVSNLNNGIYLFLLKTANSTMCKKIVVLP